MINMFKMHNRYYYYTSIFLFQKKQKKTFLYYKEKYLIFSKSSQVGIDFMRCFYHTIYISDDKHDSLRGFPSELTILLTITSYIIYVFREV